MKINFLKLQNFRNYAKLDLDFNSNKIIIIGENAQGKTNILEAIFYMASLSSYRAKADSELIQWGKDFSNIKLEINKSDTDIELEAIINPPKKKILKVNGLKKSKSSEFISNLSVVNFSTNDLLLLRGTPEDRRSWLDIAISQIYPAYLDRLTKYNKIRIQKNNYLKELKASQSIDNSMLDVWNSQLALCGSNIIFLRLNFLKELILKAKEKHKHISGNENLDIVYNSSIIGDVEITDNLIYKNEDILELFNAKLEERKQEEIIRAQSVVGAHRDDVSYFINGNDAKKFASQGQQRTIVLALKLAELNLIKQKNGHNPVLLLDDVLAELDVERQNYLLNSISDNIQTLITSTDLGNFKQEFLQDVKIYKIKNGALID